MSEPLSRSSVELFRLTRDWWRVGDDHLLPGEQGGRTVFVVDFWDGCRYFGYTRGSVFGRLAKLLSEPGSFGFNPFVHGHAARVPYLVRCVASGLDEWQARQLRNLLVSEAPADLTRFNGTTVRSAGCCLATEGSGVVAYRFINRPIWGCLSVKIERSQIQMSRKEVFTDLKGALLLP